jgi:hypothetical protein
MSLWADFTCLGQGLVAGFCEWGTDSWHSKNE